MKRLGVVLLWVALALCVVTPCLGAEHVYYSIKKKLSGNWLAPADCGGGGLCLKATPVLGGSDVYATNVSSGYWYFNVDGTGFPASFDVKMDTTSTDGDGPWITIAEDVWLGTGTHASGSITTTHILDGTLDNLDLDLSDNTYAWTQTSQDTSIAIRVNTTAPSTAVGQSISLAGTNDVGTTYHLGGACDGSILIDGAGTTGEYGIKSSASVDYGMYVTGAETGAFYASASSGAAHLFSGGLTGTASGNGLALILASSGAANGVYVGMGSYTGGGSGVYVDGRSGYQALRVTEGDIVLGEGTADDADSLAVGMRANFSQRTIADSLAAVFWPPNPSGTGTPLTVHTSSTSGPSRFAIDLVPEGSFNNYLIRALMGVTAGKFLNLDASTGTGTSLIDIAGNPSYMPNVTLTNADLDVGAGRIFLPQSTGTKKDPVIGALYYTHHAGAGVPDTLWIGVDVAGVATWRQLAIMAD